MGKIKDYGLEGDGRGDGGMEMKRRGKEGVGGVCKAKDKNIKLKKKKAHKKQRAAPASDDRAEVNNNSPSLRPINTVFAGQAIPRLTVQDYRLARKRKSSYMGIKYK